MEPRFPEEPNYRLINLMTIARQEHSVANDQAMLNELQHGNVSLLVPAEPPDESLPAHDRPITFTQVFERAGERMLVAFTGEAAIRGYAKEDLCCVAVPGPELLRVCMGYINFILLDPKSPNEVRICLTPFQGEEAA